VTERAAAGRRIRVTAVVPARYDSTRFPGKPLVPLAGKPMILHVVERVEAARSAGVLDRVLVATDDERIAKVVREAGHAVQMTASRHRTGTDRIAEVAAALDDDVVCNIQGDEPLIEVEVIAALIEPLRSDPAIQMTTLKTQLERPEDRLDPNRGKVVVDARDRALTFTRLPIVDGVSPGQAYFNRAAVEAAHARRPLTVYSDIGVYGYRREFLLRYASLPQGAFEQSERLEQLRALEHGFAIAVREAPEAFPPGVDTAEDLAHVERLLARA
jgi:3-deoxy-manno-octulosonate cytidylyltransferase (CMP-KDO synthetase)